MTRRAGSVDQRKQSAEDHESMVIGAGARDVAAEARDQDQLLGGR